MTTALTPTDEDLWASMSESLDRAEKARTMWAALKMDEHNIQPDYALLATLQNVVDAYSGASDADMKLLERADEVRRTTAVVKAAMANVSSNMPAGYSDNIGTETTQIFLSQPIELRLEQPLSPTIVVPPAEPKTKTISQGFDQYGEPQVTITSE